MSNRYGAFEKAKEYTKVYTLEPVDEILIKQEDGYLGYISAGQFATTGSNIFTDGQIILGNQTIIGDLNVNGNINVSTLISASIIYESGSTIFGNTSDDFHQFTGSIYMSGSIIDPSSITFNTASITTPLREYTLAANLTDKTVDLRMGNNATMQIGQEMYHPLIVNKSGEDLMDGTLVMFNPTGIAQGNRISVVKASNTNQYQSDFIVGILTEGVANNAEGFATWFGYVRNVSKSALQTAGLKDPVETWVEGDYLYPSPTRPGGLTNVIPSAPYWKSTICTVTSMNGDNITFLVRPHLRGKFTNLHDVNISNPQTGSMVYLSGSVVTNTENIKIQNGYTILSQVSSSYNFLNDTTAGNAGVPLGGLYHTSGTIKIRLV